MKYTSAALCYHTAPLFKGTHQIPDIFRINACTGTHSYVVSGVHLFFQILSSRYEVTLHTVRYNYIVQLSRIGATIIVSHILHSSSTELLRRKDAVHIEL